MKAIIAKISVGFFALLLASAPLAANADGWHGHGDGWHGHGDSHRDWHGRDDDHRDWRGSYRRYDGYRPGWGYRPRYVNGWYGYSPYGFTGYYSNGGWYHHRRWAPSGIWIYF